VVFALQNLGQPAADGVEKDGGGWVPDEEEAGGGTAKFDLTLTLFESEGGLSGQVEYATDLFEADTVARWMEYYERILRAMVETPERRLSEVSLLTGEERAEIVEEWQATTTEYPREATLAELFEQQAAERGDAVAVRYGSETLTYAELNAAANRVAHHLMGLGVEPGDRVAVLLERSAAWVTALVGIVKAGAAYLPLDPAYPAERLEYMQRDVGVRAVVTSLDPLPEGLCASNPEPGRATAEWRM
jgi:non-ribosomal peptide synthetase component F